MIGPMRSAACALAARSGAAPQERHGANPIRGFPGLSVMPVMPVGARRSALARILPPARGMIGPLAGVALNFRRLGPARPSAAVGRRNRLADQLLDIAQERQFLGIAQRDCDPVGPRPRRTADP